MWWILALIGGYLAAKILEPSEPRPYSRALLPPPEPVEKKPARDTSVIETIYDDVNHEYVSKYEYDRRTKVRRQEQERQYDEERQRKAREKRDQKEAAYMPTDMTPNQKKDVRPMISKLDKVRTTFQTLDNYKALYPEMGDIVDSLKANILVDGLDSEYVRAFVAHANKSTTLKIAAKTP